MKVYQTRFPAYIHFPILSTYLREEMPSSSRCLQVCWSVGSSHPDKTECCDLYCRRKESLWWENPLSWAPGSIAVPWWWVRSFFKDHMLWKSVNLIFCHSCFQYLNVIQWIKVFSLRPSDEQEALNSIMQDLAELHRSSRPAMVLSDLGKPKASSPKNQVMNLLFSWSEIDIFLVHLSYSFITTVMDQYREAVGAWIGLSG